MLDTAWKQLDTQELFKVHQAYYNFITKAKFREFIVNTNQPEPEEFADWTPFDKANHCLSVMIDIEFA